MIKVTRVRAACVAAGALVSASPGNAAITIYSGFDAGASAPGALSIAASNAFDAAVTSQSRIDFESFGSTTNGGTGPNYSIISVGFEIRTSPAFSLPALFGANTTPGGLRFAYSNSQAASLTFNFASPVNAFGAYFGGLQTASSSILFSDGTAQTIPLGGDPNNGGFSFVGFTDTNALISGITINVPFDLISVDDVRFRAMGGAVPEPGAWAMMIVGFGLVGATMRRRKTAVGTRVRFA